MVAVVFSVPQILICFFVVDVLLFNLECKELRGWAHLGVCLHNSGDRFKRCVTDGAAGSKIATAT